MLRSGFLALAAMPAALAAHGHSHDHSHEDHGHAHSHGEAAAVETAVMHSFLGGFVPFPMVAMITLFILKIGFGLAPRFFRHNVRLLSLANAFSAGIFLAGGLAHLLPEAAHAFLHVPADSHFGEVSPYVFCGLGFMLTLFLEKVLLLPPDVKRRDSDEKLDDLVEKETKHAGHGHAHSHGGCSHVNAEPPAENAPLLPLILTAVLSFHSVIGGLALGIQKDDAKAMLVFFAIVAHKWVEAFSLGVSYVSANASLNVSLKGLTAFAFSSPAGIAAGWLMREALAGSSGAALLTAALDAVASGTFIYIATVDLIVEEFGTARDKFAKYFAIVFGFVLFVVLCSAIPHVH
ncbi:Zinc/iron permease [Baffinella frigidus]|nr:Zinc/iron permease [Cryptophyta sp. CCMP2293]|mmetsp:Transcript_1892/g.4321  ORF Transcript_1892/g.4321 Transcript_1892/m.4321 type:complete len:348 (+) Transcript_1892:3-1046(+)